MLDKLLLYALRGVVVLAAVTSTLIMLLLPLYPVLVILVVLVVAACRRTVQLTSGGTACWATYRNIDRAGLLEGEGVILGTVPGELGRLDGVLGLFGRVAPNLAVRRFLVSCQRRQQRGLVRLTNGVHCACFAPTGVGKGVSVCLPFLLTCRDSMVVVDFKGENYRLSASARRRMGHRVICLDPFGIVGGTDTFNPIDFIAPDDDQALDDCRSLANALVLRSGTESEPHWNDSAEAWVAAFIALVVKYGDGDRSLQTIRPLLSDPARMKRGIEIMCGSDAWEGMLARLGNQLTHAKEKELSSVLTTVNRHLRFLDTVTVAANTRASTFDPAELVTGKMTIYLVLPPVRQREQSPLLRMYIVSMLKAVVRGGLQEKNKVYFVLDEAASLGHMDAIDDAVDKYRGYGVRLLFLFQSLGQLKKCFPDGQEQTLLSNVSQIYFGINDQQTAEAVSARLGEATVWVRGQGSSHGWSHSGEPGKPYGSSGGSSQDYKQQARRLLKPEEVMALDPRVAITFHPGVPPICTYLVRYFEGNWTPQPMGAFRATCETVCLLAAVGLAAAMVAVAFFN